MRHLVLVLLFLFSSAVCSNVRSQRASHINFDTITLARLSAGEPIRDIAVKVIAPIDTLLWGGQDGASLLKFDGNYFGQAGEFRIGTQGSFIHQITFSVRARDSNDAARLFENLDAMIEKRYGNPNEGYTNVFKVIRWKGKRQALALQTKEGTSYVSVILTELEQKRSTQ